MPKKPPKNSYYFFMQDYKRQEEAKGRRFYNGMAQVAEEAGPAWKEVSPEEKARYEAIAKQSKLQRKMDPKQKYTSYGETFSEVEQKQQTEERRNQEKKRNVEKIVQYLKPESTLRTKLFFVAHVNYYFVNNKDGFHVPAEVGLVKFNLEQGLQGAFHFFIKPYENYFPLGYAGEAKIHREKTHRIPLNVPDARQNMTVVYKKIRQFLLGDDEPGASGGELPPVYTLSTDDSQNTSEEAVCDAFKYIYDLNNREYARNNPDAWMDEFKVYDLSKLFFELKCKTGDYASSMGLNAGGLKGKFPQQSLAESELRRDVFNYTPNIACQFHEDDDNMANCSLSFARRWVYLICDYCCQDLNIPLIPESHVPPTADIDRTSRLTSLASSRVTSRAESRASCATNSHYYDDNESVSGASRASLDYSTIKSLNVEKRGVFKPPAESLPAMRLPKSTSGRGSSVWGSTASSIVDERPGRTRTDSERSVTGDSIKSRRVDEREVTNVGKSLQSLGIKPVDPSVYGIEILQGGDEIKRAEEARKAMLEAEIVPQPLFTNDSFPSLAGIGRGKRQVSSRGKK
ncbi:unnamed protein product [Bemisia tabaci]|uniref:HMG box domain-containing protein n=1 Tax=Bemisia tabaci TaxID=7038 RepID=A0A9P0A7F6_BEMTA|nr:unnamed protein product [Bemisia tabaci]